MQAIVHSVIPYIQRFLYHHDELSEVYSELIDNNIGEKIKRLHFGQVRRSQLVWSSLKPEGSALFSCFTKSILIRLRPR